MKKILSLTIGFCAAIFSSAQYNSDNLTIKEAGAINFTYKNLRLYPIYANQVFIDAHKDLGKYTSLQQALEQKKVTITETGGAATSNSNQQIFADGEQVQASSSGTVNKLMIENISNDTIMIMAGEVVKGGKQDRVLAVDMILPPMSGKKDISVFCVEHGRWSPSVGGTGFYGYSNCSGASIRKEAVVNKSQAGVWAEVEDITTKNGAETGTGTYTALDTSKTYNAELKGYIDYFKTAMQAQVNVIGVVACTGDSVIGCDMFATPDMFNQYLDILLNSYSTEAISNGKPAKTDYATVKIYLDKILADESKQDAEVEKNGTMLKNKGRKLHLAKF